MSSCFFRLIFVSPGYVPRPKDDPEKALTMPDPTTTADIFLCEAGGYPRWCRHCQVVKPDRAHHSKDCGRCTYKMGATIDLVLCGLIVKIIFVLGLVEWWGIRGTSFFCSLSPIPAYSVHSLLFLWQLYVSFPPKPPPLIEYSSWRGG